MSSPSKDADGESICWECGAPANAACTYVYRLNTAAKRRADGQGYLVMRGRRVDALRIPIPRCQTCQNRSYVSFFLIAAGALLGAVAGSALPSSKWSTFLGAFLGYLAAVLAITGCQKLSGRHFLTDYPPVRELRKSGWSEPE